MTTLEKVLEIKSQVMHRANGEVAENMRMAGIIYKVNYGVPIPELKELAKPYKGDHDLAVELYAEDIRECKILASLIADPERLTGEQLDEWAAEFTNPEIVEQVCGNLFWKSEFALSRSIEWCLSNDELLRKAGLLIVARKASDTTLKESLLEPYIGIIENMAEDITDLTLSAARFALCEIAKRSPALAAKVSETASRMTESENELAAWVGNELLFELAE
jgi:3-methyladenine DNA glycosylase AlkD